MTAAQLRAARLKMNLSQGELAEPLGVDERTVRRWENEEREIPSWLDQKSAVMVLRLHDALRNG